MEEGQRCVSLSTNGDSFCPTRPTQSGTAPRAASRGCDGLVPRGVQVGAMIRPQRWLRRFNVALRWNLGSSTHHCWLLEETRAVSIDERAHAKTAVDDMVVERIEVSCSSFGTLKPMLTPRTLIVRSNHSSLDRHPQQVITLIHVHFELYEKDLRAF